MNATYSPEDNKLRLYSAVRLDAETYAKVKAAGFKWAPKQCLFVAPAWTPNREDLLLELCGEIDDEDYSVTERAADRAERFEAYREKREGESVTLAERYEAGPEAIGHQSRERAERQAAKQDRQRVKALTQWGKAEYWQQRTEGVIAHALHRADPRTRRGRIKTLEAEQRKHEKERTEYATRHAAWVKVSTLEGADSAGVYEVLPDSIGFRPDTMTPALRLAYSLANYGFSRSVHTHPRTGETERSLYDLLTHRTDPLTPREAATLWLDRATDPADPDTHSARWSNHYTNRLAYERAMLANEGGTAADADMKVGGWIGDSQIHQVNRSSATGKVVSVRIDVGNGKLKLCNIERLPEGVYRDPSEEDVAAVTAAKQEKKAAKPTAPSLINPTDEDAQKLQDLWNSRSKARYEEWKKGDSFRREEYTPTQVRRMTQAEYSARSKGDYGTAETIEVMENGHRKPQWHERGVITLPIVCKVRKTYAGNSWTGAAMAVIVITDKPQKPLPLDWEAIEAGEYEPKPETATSEQ